MPGVLKPPPGTGAAAPTSVRIPKSMLEEIDASAQALGLSRNVAIVQLLRFALDSERKLKRRRK